MSAASFCAATATRASANGYFMSPAVISEVPAGSRLLREEIFGPVVAVRAVDALDEAMAIADETEYGLALSLVTNDLAVGHPLRPRDPPRRRQGQRPTTGVSLNAPFGGFKHSSNQAAKEQGGPTSWTSTPASRPSTSASDRAAGPLTRSCRGHSLPLRRHRRLVFIAALLQGIGGLGFAMVSAPIAVLLFPRARARPPPLPRRRPGPPRRGARLPRSSTGPRSASSWPAASSARRRPARHSRSFRRRCSRGLRVLILVGVDPQLCRLADRAPAQPGRGRRRLRPHGHDHLLRRAALRDRHAACRAGRTARRRSPACSLPARCSRWSMLAVVGRFTPSSSGSASSCSRHDRSVSSCRARSTRFSPRRSAPVPAALSAAGPSASCPGRARRLIRLRGRQAPMLHITDAMVAAASASPTRSRRSPKLPQLRPRARPPCRSASAPRPAASSCRRWARSSPTGVLGAKVYTTIAGAVHLRHRPVLGHGRTRCWPRSTPTPSPGCAPPPARSSPRATWRGKDSRDLALFGAGVQGRAHALQMPRPSRSSDDPHRLQLDDPPRSPARSRPRPASHARFVQRRGGARPQADIVVTASRVDDAAVLRRHAPAGHLRRRGRLEPATYARTRRHRARPGRYRGRVAAAEPREAGDWSWPRPAALTPAKVVELGELVTGTAPGRTDGRRDHALQVGRRRARGHRHRRVWPIAASPAKETGASTA